MSRNAVSVDQIDEMYIPAKWGYCDKATECLNITCHAIIRPLSSTNVWKQKLFVLRYSSILQS